MGTYLGHYSSITILITTTVYKILSLDVHPPLSDNEMRILKILLAEHLDQLNENGVSLDLGLSGTLVLSKQNIVEGLHLIGQVSMAKILGNKQGKLSPSTTNHSLDVNLKYRPMVLIIILHFFGMDRWVIIPLQKKSVS